jgi:hypothetical protein
MCYAGGYVPGADPLQWICHHHQQVNSKFKILCLYESILYLYLIESNHTLYLNRLSIVLYIRDNKIVLTRCDEFRYF